MCAPHPLCEGTLGGTLLHHSEGREGADCPLFPLGTPIHPARFSVFLPSPHPTILPTNAIVYLRPQRVYSAPIFDVSQRAKYDPLNYNTQVRYSNLRAVTTRKLVPLKICQCNTVAACIY